MTRLWEVLSENVLDTLKLIPFLFLTYLILEWIENKANERTVEWIRKSGKNGPLYGSLLGLIPLCGFSSAAANFYTGKIITRGTLIAVFLATSDEMIPILISGGISAAEIFGVLWKKWLIAILAGYLIDFLLRRDKNEKFAIEQMCEDAGCECEEGGIARSALVHTVKTGLFILGINLALGLFVEYAGEDVLRNLFRAGAGIWGVLLMAVIGLIPNCGISVLITALYVEGTLGYGAFMAGLLSNAGVGLAVLFHLNHDKKDVLKITGILVMCAVAAGLLFNLWG